MTEARRAALQAPSLLQADHIWRPEPPILAIPLGRRVEASILFRDGEQAQQTMVGFELIELFLQRAHVGFPESPYT